MSLNLLNGSLNLNEVSIKEKEVKSDKGQLFLLSLNQLTVSFDVLSSYIKRAPVVKKVILRGGHLSIPYDDSGNFILPEFLNSEKAEKSSEPLNIPKLLKENIGKIPFEIEGINLAVQLGVDSQPNYQKISFSHLEIRKEKDAKNIPSVKLNLAITDTSLRFPWLLKRISISLLNIDFVVNANGGYFFHNIELKSNLANLSTDAKGLIAADLMRSNYSANVKYLDINAKEVFELLEMEAQGRAVLTGVVVSGKTLKDDPLFNGKAKWHDFKLKHFEIYSGQAEVSFKDRTIHYDKAEVRTPQKGVVRAEGKYQLFDKFYFENTAYIENFSFAELLIGLGVPFSPMDFRINSQDMHVSGYIMSPNEDKGFEIFAKGNGKANNMIVTSFTDQSAREPIPKMDFNLNLSSSLLGIHLDNTKILATKNNSGDWGSVIIKKGFIDFIPEEGIGVHTKLDGENINLSSLAYFLKFPSKGIGNFSGEVNVKPGSTDVVFTANAAAKNAELFGIKFSEFEGKIGLNSANAWANDSLFVLSNMDKSKFSKIHVSDLQVAYSDLKSKIKAYANNVEMEVFSYSVAYWLKPQFSNATGLVKKISTEMEGLLLHPSTWDLSLNTNIHNLKIVNGHIKESNILLKCKEGVCSNSLLSFTDIKSNNENSNQNNGTSFAIFELSNFSFDNSSFRAKISKFPLSFFSSTNLKQNLDGYLNSNIQLNGKWKNLEGFIDIHGDNVIYNDLNIGDFSLTGNPTNQKQMKFNLKSFSNQLSATYITPQTFEGSSTLEIDFLNFDMTSILSDDIRSRNNLFSQLSGKFKLTGQSPFSPQIQSDWYRLWSGTGSIESGILQFGRMIFDVSNNNQMSFDGNEFKMSPLSLSGQLGKVEFGQSLINFKHKSLSSSVSFDLNLNKIEQVNDFFGPSEGSVLGKFILEGGFKEPKFSGSLNIDANTLSLRNYQPAFTNLTGHFVFNGNKLELQGFDAEKGGGTVTGAGSIDFSNIFKENSEPPELSFRFSARRADLRVPVPIFQIADTNFDADLSLTGAGKPYFINGDVNFKKLKLFKDIPCNEIANQFIAQSNLNNQQSSEIKPFANLNVNFQAINTFSIQSQCIRGKFSTAPNLMVTGDTNNPILVGTISTDSANLFLLRSRFEIKKADFTFVELQKYDPNVDIQMESRISTFTIFANMNGKFSRARLDLSIQPLNLPNGDRLTQADIISIISTGQIPTQSSSANLLSASTGVFSFFGGGSVADLGFLNNTLSTVTGGLVDNVSIIPTTQNGQLSWRATVSRSLSERLNLGVSYQGAGGDVGASQSAYATFLLNDTISLFSSFSSSTPSASQIQTTNEFTGGLRFRFGGQ
ncbi:translocation/assembly module TamB domain-containing protein [Silvanigrella aquatica]|uniref:translocation/assembly module TamB domain-containing protein n=1 Tax=Silvanigrella aquatica TaxID=1915309 RepID=UPI0011E59535|nr:hypothetical protein [Silvanigrella aquatica]